MAQQIPSVKLSNGKSMPILGLGTYATALSGEREKIEQAVYDAICHGYRLIDTAWVYEVEEQVGRGAKRAIDEGIVKREDLFITTKIWQNNMRKDNLLKQAKESNDKIGLGYIDLLLVHYPVAVKNLGDGNPLPLDEKGEILLDDDIDINEETWRTMEETVDLGIAKSIGVSNYNIRQLKSLLDVARIKPVVNQVECTPYLPQKKLIAFAKENGVVIEAYSPLGGGTREAKWCGGVEGEHGLTKVRINLFQEEPLKALAAKYGKSVAQVLLRFQIERGVIAIAQSIVKTQMAENSSIFDFSLTPDEIASLEALENGHRSADFRLFPQSKNFPFHED